MAAVRLATRMLEREREIEALERAWRDACAGHGSTWLLRAEAGGGKTRLLTEFLRLAGGRALVGAAEPLAPPEPYLAVSRALPDFVPAPTRGESVTRALAALAGAAGDAPAILVLDDLHFADDGTVAVLLRLAAECAARPWLVLAAYRPDEGPAALQPGATELVSQGQASRLDLPPLSRKAVATLIGDVRGATGAPADLEAIYADSGGNPWFAEALARGNGAVSAARDRISLRLDRLEAAAPGALRVLRALAPATRPLPHALAAVLCGGDCPDLRRLLGWLRDGGVLHETEDGAWAFRHELLRRSVLEGMITADRRDAHLVLAEALQTSRSGDVTGRRDSRLPTLPHQPASAAEIAMHFAEAEDARAVEWALRAAAEARAVDAHVEAMAQLERALAFELEPERRRTTLAQAAVEAYDLGRYDAIVRLVEEALAIPGGRPEALASLHQHAARAARELGDLAADEEHLAAAERSVEGLPPGRSAVSIAMARVARAAVDARPEQLAPAAERAFRLAAALDDAALAVIVEAQVKVFLAVSHLDAGDPIGLTILEEVLALAAAHALPGGLGATALLHAYAESTISLFHAEAAGLHARAVAALQEHELDWLARIEPYRVLALVQGGRFEEARTLAAAIEPPVPGTLEHAVLLCAGALRETRAGSLNRARTLLAEAKPGDAFQARALIDLARLELAMLTDDPALAGLAREMYDRMAGHHHARIAGLATVALARSGQGAAPVPDWLEDRSPLRVLWDWADGLHRGDTMRLRDVAARLEAMSCPYEAALALGDAGNLGEAYRRLRALGATTAREQLAARLRAAGEPVPRRSRAAVEQDSLSDAERALCRLVAAGARNEAIAAELDVSLRTVEAYLGRIYAKTDLRGKAALAAWWVQREASPP